MRTSLIVLLFSLFFLGDVQAQDTVKPDSFIGHWVIDLRPGPDAEEYLKDFIVNKTDDGYTGEFYGSPIEGMIINDVWGDQRFAFVTHDASNTYYHSGTFKNGVLEGFTYCPDRGFAMPWFGKEKMN